MSHGNTRWLEGLPQSVRNKVHAITIDTTYGRESLSGNWWLRQTPSVGPARNADLLLKTRDGHVVSVEPVMRDGEPVGRFA